MRHPVHPVFNNIYCSDPSRPDVQGDLSLGHPLQPRQELLRLALQRQLPDRLVRQQFQLQLSSTRQVSETTVKYQTGNNTMSTEDRLIVL